MLFFHLQATHKNLYKYHAKEQYFGDKIDQTFEMTIQFGVYCKSGKKHAVIHIHICKIFSAIRNVMHFGSFAMFSNGITRTHSMLHQLARTTN